MFVIGVDIGGTNLKIGLISVENNKIIDSNILSTNSFDVVKQVINAIYEIIEKNQLTIKDIEFIGVGCPGIVKEGVVLASVNLGLENCKLQQLLLNEFRVKTRVLNDGEMAALAENKLGAGENAKNMIMLTFGTGVGGAIILNGEIYQGNGAGELGHITYIENGNPCNCGRNGCIEKYVSCKALSELTKEKINQFAGSNLISKEDISVVELVEAYKKQDICAIEIIETYTRRLSDCLLNYCNIFRPDIIVVGGGLTYAPLIIDKAINICKEKNYGYPNSPGVKISKAKLGNDAGILGALALIK